MKITDYTLMACLLITAAGLGQTPAAAPLPPQAQPTTTGQLAIANISQLMTKVNEDFKKNHIGYHIEWGFNIVPDGPPQPLTPAQHNGGGQLTSPKPK